MERLEQLIQHDPPHELPQEDQLPVEELLGEARPESPVPRQITEREEAALLFEPPPERAGPSTPTTPGSISGKLADLVKQLNLPEDATIEEVTGME